MNITQKTIYPDGTGKTYAFEIPPPASGDGSGYFFAVNVGLMKTGPATPLSPSPCPVLAQVCPYRGPNDVPPAGGFQADGIFMPQNLPKDDSELAWLGMFCVDQRFTGPANSGGQWFAAVNADAAAPSSAVILVVG